MKRILILVLFWTSLPYMATAQVGCLSQSKQLRESFDHKEYGPVACGCPCDHYQSQGKHSTDRNKCLECGHFHYPRLWIFISKTVPKQIQKSRLAVEHPLAALRALIAKYKQKHQYDPLLTGTG